MVTPLSVSAPFWNKLLRASVVPNGAGYVRIRRQATDVDSDVRRPPAGSPADTAERARIHAELDRVGLALRT